MLALLNTSGSRFAHTGLNNAIGALTALVLAVGVLAACSSGSTPPLTATSAPSGSPVARPTVLPSAVPGVEPGTTPAGSPTPVPSPMPTDGPAVEPVASPSSPQQEFSTPELIDQALAAGDITAEQRWLYLAYAVYEYESLPARFRSNVRWDGTFVVKELKEVAASPAMMCSLGIEAQSELRRLLHSPVICDN